jgi:hypothetical protein
VRSAINRRVDQGIEWSCGHRTCSYNIVLDASLSTRARYYDPATMTDTPRYPESRVAFEALLGNVERVVDTSARLPDWPLRSRRTANVDVCQYSHALGGAFGPVLQSLADFHGDDVVTTLVLDPTITAKAMPDFRHSACLMPISPHRFGIAFHSNQEEIPQEPSHTQRTL